MNLYFLNLIHESSFRERKRNRALIFDVESIHNPSFLDRLVGTNIILRITIFSISFLNEGRKIKIGRNRYFVHLPPGRKSQTYGGSFITTIKKGTSHIIMVQIQKNKICG
jgi:hypothetical protein